MVIQVRQERVSSGERMVFINDKIKAFNVIVLWVDGENLGVMPRARALAMAQELGMDLVQVAYNPQDKVSTAKITDFGRFQYDKKKKDKEKKKQQKQQSKWLKQVKISYSIWEHDLNMKLDKVKEAIDKWYSVKILTQLRWRENSYKSVVVDRLKKIIVDFQTMARAQSAYPKEEKNAYSIILAPLK